MNHKHDQLGFRVPLFLAICLACLFCFSSPVTAADSVPTLSPFIRSIFPRGGQQGHELKILIEGSDLEKTSEVRVSGQGVRCKVMDSSESQITAQVTIAPNAPVGRRDLRVITPRGTFVQMFEVGGLSEQMEPEPNDDWATAPMVEMPLILNGKILAEDYDHFRFRAKASQELCFDLNSSRNGSRFDAVLSLLDDQGNEIAAQDDFYFDKDPRLVYRFSRAGVYVLRVNGYRESGSPSAEYRLMMGELPSLAYVFPVGAPRGKTVDLVLSGSNLDRVTDVDLGRGLVPVQIKNRTAQELKVRMTVPPRLEPGSYPLWVRCGQAAIPNPLIFVVSDDQEMVLTNVKASKIPFLIPPVIVNGQIRQPKQTDSFWIEANAGDSFTFEAQGMRLGNFLDPAITIYDSAGSLVAYMDETAPNGFDKEPPQLDFCLLHRFESAGRYRAEIRDASLRGRDDFVYRLSVKRAEPSFELIVLTNQITVLPGQPAKLPVRVKRRGGWNVPVEVWAEALPQDVTSKPALAEPINTRFRGTFGEDFFFDGTNVELPLEAKEEAALGTYPLRIRGRGVVNGKTVEQTATVYYPWQQTGYVRGRTEEQAMLMTVAQTPLFELEAPPSLLLTRGKAVELTLSVRWFAGSKQRTGLAVEPVRLPTGLTIERFEIGPGDDKISVWITSDGNFRGLSDRLCLAGVLHLDKKVYRSAAPDINVQMLKENAGPEVAAK
jgi:IPT/TIG domain-containing protein